MLSTKPLSLPLSNTHNTRHNTVYEEINANVIVVGDYKAFRKDNPSQTQRVDVVVRCSALLVVQCVCAGGACRWLPLLCVYACFARGVAAAKAAFHLALSITASCRRRSTQRHNHYTNTPHHNTAPPPHHHTTTPPPTPAQVSDHNNAAIFTATGQEKGQFAFTSKAAGEYKACFTAPDAAAAAATKVALDWRTGVAATDWDAIAKKEHLDALSVEMRKVEGAVREIYAEMLQLQQREQVTVTVTAAAAVVTAVMVVARKGGV